MSNKGKLADNSIKRYATRSGAVTGAVFYSIWFAIAIVCFIVGFVLFLGYEGIDKIVGWVVWGLICAIPIIGTMLRLGKRGAGQGAQKGANTYSVDVSDDSVTVKNHPFSYAILGFFCGLLGGALAGPIVLPCYMILNGVRIGSAIKQAMQFKKEEKSAN